MLRKLFSCVGRFFEQQDGLTTVEYAAIIALVAVVVIGGVTLVGLNLPGVFDRTAPSANSGP